MNWSRHCGGFEERNVETGTETVEPEEQHAATTVQIDERELQEAIGNQSGKQVAAWLEQNSLGMYTSLLLQNGFDEMETLLHVEERDLEKLDILIGHRRKIMMLVGRAVTSTRSSQKNRTTIKGKTSDSSPPEVPEAMYADDEEIDGSCDDESEFWRDLYEKHKEGLQSPRAEDATMMRSRFVTHATTAAKTSYLVEKQSSISEKSSMEILQSYDTSFARLKHIFLIHKDFVQSVKSEKLNLDLASFNESAAQQILQHFVKTHRLSKNIPQDEPRTDLKLFFYAVKRLRLTLLFNPDADTLFESGRPKRAATLWVCDYNSDFLDIKLITQDRPTLPSNNMESHSTKTISSVATHLASQSRKGIDVLEMYGIDFFFSSRKFTRDHTRWLHLDASSGLDRLTVLRLAVKYNLHPLAIDDIIDNRTPTKLDRIADYTFVSLDIATLETQDGRGGPPPRVKVNRSNAAILLHKGKNSIITILQNRPDKSSWLAKWWRADCNDDEQSYGREDWSLWSNLQEDLSHEPARRVRENNAKFLLFVLLDKVADQLRPIAEAYANRLGHMHQQNLRTFSSEWLAELDEMQIELVDLARLIRPIKQVLHHLVEEKDINAEEKMFLEDVDDAIDQFLGDLDQLKIMGRSLEEACEVCNDRRMNATLFNLSVFGAIFLPAQFVTGVYGMNFQTADGLPAMPELLWEDGYMYFWLLELGCIAAGLGLWGVSYVLNSFGLSKRELCKKYLCKKRGTKPLSSRERFAEDDQFVQHAPLQED